MTRGKLNAFEKILLFVGVAVLLGGYGIISQQVKAYGMNWDAVQTIFLWFILIALIIQIAVNENIKEEIKHVINLNLKEIGLLKGREKR
ncbi:hypothetical protein KY339_05285 [Candidatus Woesearchaeota archaeon]|nr:hypothetical protein [Candidatus Woesearchaeota archaeon]